MYQLVHTSGPHAGDPVIRNADQDIAKLGSTSIGFRAVRVAAVSGARPPYLQRRGNALFLRVRVPGDLRAIVGMREIRRALGTDSLSNARPLAIMLGARAMEIFEMVRREQLTKEQTRALVGLTFNDLRKTADRGFRPSSDLPELEIEEQRELASGRIATLEDQIALSRFDGSVEGLAAVRAGRAGSQARLQGPSRDWQDRRGSGAVLIAPERNRRCACLVRGDEAPPSTPLASLRVMERKIPCPPAAQCHRHGIPTSTVTGSQKCVLSVTCESARPSKETRVLAWRPNARRCPPSRQRVVR